MAASENARTGRRLLGSNDASLMLSGQPAVQSVKHHDHRTGMAAALLTGQQLQIVADADRLLELARQAWVELPEDSAQQQSIVDGAELLGQLMLQDIERQSGDGDADDGVSPNPPKGWSLALTPCMMGKGNRQCGFDPNRSAECRVR